MSYFSKEKYGNVKKGQAVSEISTGSLLWLLSILAVLAISEQINTLFVWHADFVRNVKYFRVRLFVNVNVECVTLCYQ